MAILDLIQETIAQHIISPKVLSYFGSKLNEVQGRFVSANRVYNFVLNKKGVSYSPAGQGDSLLFSALFLERLDAVRRPKVGNDKCNAGKSYQCGKICLGNGRKCHKGVRDVNDARRIASILESTNEKLKREVPSQVSEKALAKGNRLRDNKVKGRALLEGKVKTTEGKAKNSPAKNLDQIKKLFNKPEDKQIVSDFADLLHPSTLNTDMRVYPKLFDRINKHVDDVARERNSILLKEDHARNRIEQSNRWNDENKEYVRPPEDQAFLDNAKARDAILEKTLNDFYKVFNARQKEIRESGTQKLSQGENYKKEMLSGHLASIPVVKEHVELLTRIHDLKGQVKRHKDNIKEISDKITSGEFKASPKRKKEIAESAAKIKKHEDEISSLEPEFDAQKSEVERHYNLLGYTHYPMEQKNINQPTSRAEKVKQLSDDATGLIAMLDKVRGYYSTKTKDQVKSIEAEVKAFLDKNINTMAKSDVARLERALGLSSLAKVQKSAQGSVDEPRLKSANP